jgi:GTPase Era involved in 16S rRNA processing/uncharacterized protein (DUF697 family)
MGSKPSKPANPQTNFKTVVKIQINDKRTEQMKILLENIKIVVEKMKHDVKIHPLIPNKLFKDLFDTLDSLGEIMDPERPNVCYCFGNTCVGKSSVINSICEAKMCEVSDDDNFATVDFQVVSVPGANASFVDGEGFGVDSTNTRLVEKYKVQVQKTPPDVILLIVVRQQLREESSLKNVTYSINQILEWLKKQRYGVEVPVVCVLNKIDEYFDGRLPNSEGDEKKVDQYMRRALTKVNKYLQTPASHCIAVSAKENYGIDQLRNIVNAQSPLNAQISSKNVDYVSRYRLSIVNKIIATFSTVSAAVSFLPIADIAIVTVLQEWMYRMLACFSVDPSRTPDSFKIVHRTFQGVGLGIRAGALFIGGAFQLSIVGYLVGSAICVAASSSSTATLGWLCYRYFTE